MLNIMKNQETPRQMKINTVIQHEIAYLIQDAIRISGTPNLMVSVTKVKVAPDISIAKVYISVFPKDKVDMYIENLKTNKYLKLGDTKTTFGTKLIKKKHPRFPDAAGEQTLKSRFSPLITHTGVKYF